MGELVVAFDPAQVSGLAWTQGEMPGETERWALPGDAPIRFARLLEKLKRFEDAKRFAIEDVHPQSGDWARWYFGYRAVFETFAGWAGIEMVYVHPVTLKKWATGSARPTPRDLELEGLDALDAALDAKKAGAKERDYRRKALKSKAEKTRMKRAACARWPEHADRLRALDGNEIDALWLLAYALEKA